MIRRALLSAVLIAFVFGVFSSEAAAQTWIKHGSRIVILNEGGDPIQGDIRSGHYDCTRSRLVGLFQQGVQVDITRSNARGRFTLDAPAPGTYDVIAFRHAIVCPHLCPERTVSVTVGD
jgi:hypothetical protein